MEAARAAGRRVADVLQAHTGGRLLGVYLHGSAALGGFVPGRSDLDVLGVTAQPLGEPVLTGLGEALLDADVSPAAGLEFSLVTAPTVASPLERPPFEVHVSTGGDRRVVFGREYGGDPDLVAHFETCRQRGVTVEGLLPEQVFAPVPRELVLASLRADLAWARTNAPFEYLVLNGCRTLHFAETGVLVSKVAGGEWALLRCPDGRAIRAALRTQSGEAAGPATPSELRVFVEWLEARLGG
jgi:streptomycin 3"-adenylyltransferase